nr:carboxypeptidase regulatory-like domain-containing protein [Arcicella sp.]
MEGTSTFTDGASNQTNLTISSQSAAKGNAFRFAKDLFRKVKQLFVQENTPEPVVDAVFIEENTINIEPAQTVLMAQEVIEKAIPSVVIKKESQFSHINYQLNIQQMNLFTYLRRAITSSEESLNGQFLEKFKNFLSVIVGTAPDKNAPLGVAKRDFGILSYLGGSQLLSSKNFNHQAMRSWASVMFLTLMTAFGTLAQSTPLTSLTDLAVKKTINTQNPSLGQDVTYTIKLKNESALKATGVELTDVLPAGVTLKTVSVGGVGSTTTSTTAGVTKVVWNVGEVAATPTELTMTIVATVTSRGLWFNIAEVTKQNEQDVDSTPNNNSINEDDQDAVCFSVAEYFYKGDEFQVRVPVGYTDITWTKKVGTGAAVPITASTPGVSLSADGSVLTVSEITAYTEFEFSAKNKNCPVGGCCPAKFIPGPYGSIGDFVFNDLNGDGKQDIGETGISGIKVILYKEDGVTKVDEVTTDANGKYLFDSLFSDKYKVKFILPSGQTFSPSKATGTGFTDANDSDAGTDGFSPVITIDVEKTGKDRDNLDVDAGLIGNLGSIGDFVWRDDNGNGIQDAGEPGIAGVTVNLYKGTTFQTSVITDTNGKYTFSGLTSGAYQVEFITPTQSRFSPANKGTDDTKDSDVGANGKSQVVNIDVTKLTTDTLRNNPNIDAGIVPLGSIGDYVFNDNNGNGIQDAGDTKLPGIKVTLTDKDGNIITTTTTDADGKYEFIVPSGQYVVIFDKPAGSTYSPKGAGTPQTDSDAGTDGKTGIITIDATKPVGDPARNNKDVDAGLIPNKGTIGDFVWVDANGNNKQDSGEAGVPGVTVELYDATGTTKQQTTVTDANGKYLFSGLETGGYKVKFILPSGKTFVTPNATGVLPADDSDAGTGGFSGVINIDVTKPLGDIGRNNLTIDAGIKADCNINAGTLLASTPNVCLPDGGTVTLTATTGTSPTVPTGYSVKYVLTKGSDLVIQQVANTPTFNVNATGEYRIHTLVFNGNSSSSNFLDLSVVVPGQTKGGDVVGIITNNKLCAALDVTGAKFNVGTSPAAPVFAAKTICAGEKVMIGDTGPAQTGLSYAWYSSLTATTPFATTQSIEVSPTVTTTYYVETTLTTIGACPSKRGSVVVTVNPKPENPVAKSSLTNDCTKNLSTVNLADAITSTPSGSVIEWHVANDPASAIITNTTTVGAGTYYAFSKSTAGCYSAGVSVTVTINNCQCTNPATVSITPLTAICGSTTTPVQLAATLGGGATSGTWTSNGTGTFDNATSVSAKYTPSASDVTKGSVELTFTTNDPDGAGTLCIAASAK